MKEDTGMTGRKPPVPILLPVRSALFLLTFVIGAAIVGKSVDEIGNWWSVVATVMNILVILLLFFVAKKDGKSYGEMINYRKGATKAKDVVIMSLISVFVGMGCMYLAGLVLYGSIFPPVSLKMVAPIGKPLAILNVLLLPLTVPFAEDGLYLGYGVNRIAERGGEMANESKTKWMAIAIPAFFYALQHCFIPTMFDVKYMVYRFLSFLPLTVIYCINYYKKRNPVPIMVGHGILDLATAMMIFATSVFPGVYDELAGMM